MADASDLLASIRSQIPDKVANVVTDDGGAFSRAELLRWLNDAGRLLCTTAPVIQDWGGVPSVAGMDTYEIDSLWVGIEQVWYDLLPLGRTAVVDDLFSSKVQGRAWWFSPHSVHAVPRLHVWPNADRSGASTTLSSAISSTSTSLPLASVSGFLAYGYARVGNELVLYRTVDSSANTLTNILRGQGGTVAASHASGTTVRECNIFWKGSRLPRPLSAVTDPVEVPQGLWPLLELYVLGKVREAEQDHQTSQAFLTAFTNLTNDLANKLHAKAGLKQGLQVRLGWSGRVYVP